MGGAALTSSEVSRATLGRIPVYLKYLKGLPPEVENISATAIAKALGLGEVQVRKDLGAISGAGKPRIGYQAAELAKSLAHFLEAKSGGAIIIGAGKLGRALLDYGGFSEYGLEILAAFDLAVTAPGQSDSGKSILPMQALESFCQMQKVQIGIIAVPVSSAQTVCDRLAENHIRAIWSFAPCQLAVPPDTVVQYENMALSLAHLHAQIQSVNSF